MSTNENSRQRQLKLIGALSAAVAATCPAAVMANPANCSRLELDRCLHGRRRRRRPRQDLHRQLVDARQRARHQQRWLRFRPALDGVHRLLDHPDAPDAPGAYAYPGAEADPAGTDPDSDASGTQADPAGSHAHAAGPDADADAGACPRERCPARPRADGLLAELQQRRAGADHRASADHVRHHRSGLRELHCHRRPDQLRDRSGRHRLHRRPVPC